MNFVDRLHEKVVNLQKKLDSVSMSHPASAWWVKTRKQLTEEKKD